MPLALKPVWVHCNLQVWSNGVSAAVHDLFFFFKKSIFSSFPLDCRFHFFVVESKLGKEDMIAKQISKAHKKSFFKGYQMQPWAKFHLFYKLRYVMNRCFTSEETPCKKMIIQKYLILRFQRCYLSELSPRRDSHTMQLSRNRHTTQLSDTELLQFFPQ